MFQKIIALLLASSIICIAGEQGSAKVGEFIDADYIEKAGKASDAADAANTGKKAFDAAKSPSSAGGAAKDVVSKYQQSKNGLMYWFKKVQGKVNTILGATKKKVNKWRTTLPRLKSMTKQTKNFFGGSYHFVKTFKLSDAWDIDRQWSRELDYRVLSGKSLGLNIFDYFASRDCDEDDIIQAVKEGFNENAVDSDCGSDVVGPIRDAFTGRHQAELDRRSPDGFQFDHANNLSPIDKRVYFIQSEALNVLNIVQGLAKDEYSPAKGAAGLSKQGYDNKKIAQFLDDDKSDYTDHISLQQDIYNKQYEIAYKRSIIQDELANLDLLWGSLEITDMEKRELQKANVAREFAKLGGYDNGISLDDYMKEKFGDRITN